jgi:membrane protein implicated in regulation of membrane protease activity
VRNRNLRRRLLGFLLLSVTLGLSIFAVSNLMSILLAAAMGRIVLANELLAVAYLLIAVGTIVVLARAIYRVDKQAGRIRNKVGWFE